MIDPAVPPEVRSAKGETRIEEPSELQRTIARRAAEARATVPDLELRAEIDMSASVALQEQQGCSVEAILMHACAVALRDVPRANGAYRDGRFEVYSRVNGGLVVATGDGYVTPTVLDADLKSLSALSDEIEQLTRRARAGQLPPPAFSGATFTLSYVGQYGVASSTIPIDVPQAAAFAAGAIRAAALVRDGAVVAGHSMTLTLACDHRILYGVEAARLLTAIQSRLEHPTL